MALVNTCYRFVFLVGAALGLSPPTEFKWTDGFGSVLPVVYVQNSEAELLCQTNMQPPVEITFLKDGHPFTKRLVGRLLKLKNGIRLPDVLSQYDKGNYTCIVKNNYTQMMRTFIVDIIIQYRGPPEFTHPPDNRTVNKGDDVEFICRFLTGDQAHVQWLKHFTVNGSYLNENKTAYVHVLKTGVEDMDRLVLRNVTLEDAGWYTCYVTNSYGVIHSGAWLEVRDIEVTSLPVYQAATDSHQVYVVAAVFGALGIIITTGILVCCYIKRRPRKERQLMFHQSPIYFQTPPVDTKWEFSRQNLQLGELLGEGAFGKVYKGYALGIDGRMEPTVVAVKMLKDDAGEREVQDLLQEMDIMKSIGRHGNIINFLGCCTRADGPLQVIVEFAANGNLRDYLRQHVPVEFSETGLKSETHCQESNTDLSYKELVSFARQVSRGMQYLASKKIIHRDLAARNVLVTDENLLKIADFGLTRNIGHKDYYQRMTDGRLPVKWMAPESLVENRYTTKSDIWSFGILLWEIFSYGSTPYPTVPVEQLYHLLRQGYRMEKPSHATDDIYELMQLCWKYYAPERPDFEWVYDCLDDMVSKSVSTNYLNLQSLPEVVDPADNDVFDDTDHLLGAASALPMARVSDSQYASMSSSEPISSSANSVNHCDSLVFSESEENLHLKTVAEDMV